MNIESKLSPDEAAQMLEWGERALKGMDSSHVFMGILDGEPLSVARLEFTLHIGHCLLTDKPMILAVPSGVVLPQKLEAVADKVVRYNPDDLPSLQAGIAQALTEMGVKKQ